MRDFYFRFSLGSEMFAWPMLFAELDGVLWMGAVLSLLWLMIECDLDEILEYSDAYLHC